MAEATNPTLTAVEFHGVEWDVTRTAPGRESLLGRCTVEWRGEQVDVDVRASRYVARYEGEGDKWTPWNVYVEGAGTEARARAFRPACIPLVEAWIASDDYGESRMTAVAYMLKEVVQREATRYGTHRAREALRSCVGDVRATDYRNLDEALDALDEYLRIMEEVPA
jgi:hypothetical protein